MTMWDVATTKVPSGPVDSESFVRAAGHARRRLPAEVQDALIDLADHSPRQGYLLLRNIDIGSVPATPSSPTATTGKDLQSEFALLSIARCLGQPVGYLPEHNGSIVQNIVPVRGTETRQISTSSGVELKFHTETAFHPYRPRYLLLLCLRGDRQAGTLVASIYDIVGHLSSTDLEVLRQSRFRTAVDASFLNGSSSELGPAQPILSGSDSDLTFVYDADLMVGTDSEAQDVLERLANAIGKSTKSVVLDAGDLLVIDNNVAVHGRSPFVARFDGTDRWLQRTFVVSDLSPSASDRIGRIITTTFD
ncbi:MAG: TauD/TfdA family dioxygenase [Ilumatobacteraceae bacterium]